MDAPASSPLSGVGNDDPPYTDKAGHDSMPSTLSTESESTLSGSGSDDSIIQPVKLDETGKVELGHLYNQVTPIDYYQATEQLEYCLAQRTKPVFSRIVQLLQAQKKKEKVKIVDVGCSYGVNAALLKYSFDLQSLNDHYRRSAVQKKSRAALVLDDRSMLGAKPRAPIEIVGVDIAENALEYAMDAGFLDAKVAGNFEEISPSESQRMRLGNADLIISSGCIGYVTEKTIAKLYEAAAPNQPWMVHSVLRMFSFDGVQTMLKEHGYVTALKSRQPVRQRRFASAAEKDEMLRHLEELCIDSTGLEQDGWCYADIFFSRPANDSKIELPEELQALFGASAEGN